MKQFILWLFLGAVLSLLSCCNPDQKNESALPRVVTTTGMLGDALSFLLEGQAEVITLMKPGVDPHLYKATQSDLRKMQDADIIVYNGLFLEGKLAEVLERLGRTKTSLAAAELLPDSVILLADDNAKDPHIWMDPLLWGDMLELLAKRILESQLFDAVELNERLVLYTMQIRAAHEEALNLLGSIPSEKRVLITAHDAFAYFGDRYQLEVRGLQGISTLAEFGLRDVTELVDFIIARDIPAIFIESSVSDKSIQAVIQGSRARGHEIRIGGTLYSDALGAVGTPEGSYLGMFMYNVREITKALSGN